jgi:hypothetical protein
VILVARAPDGGSPPPWDLGARFSQKRVWFVWPPGWGVLGCCLVVRYLYLSCQLTTVEVDERLLGDLSLDVTLVLGLLELLDGGVVGGDIGVVVLGVVQLHDLAADGGLERAVVVCDSIEVSMVP